MRRIWRPLLGLVVVLLALAVAGATYQAIATERAERAYPPPGEMVDVGGYKLHINCEGQGSPTVVLDAGSGGFSAQWVRVQREVSGTTRVCSYDRAGMGWSEMGPEPRDAKQISSELHTLLKGANIEGPYVLVGHSFGGLYVRTYAARYPDEVAGVVLVDSSSPKQVSHQPVTRDSNEPQKQSFAVVPRLARLGVSLAARLGVVRLLSKLAPASPDLPPQQRAQIDALTPSTRQVTTYALELLAPTQTLRLGSPGSLGNKPLAVVTAPKQAEPGWLKLQDDLATLSSKSIDRVVKGATHTSLLYDRNDAQATSAAIDEVVAAVRNDRPLAR
jgi:pimeloyl-ACP methyl ester carboxylesterase